MRISSKKELLQRLSLFLLIVLLTALFIGGHQPESGRLFPAPWDKLVHFGFYGLLTVIAAIAFPNFRPTIMFLFIFGIGCADEIHQMYVLGRHPGLDDLTADCIGTISALLILQKLRKKFNLID